MKVFGNIVLRATNRQTTLVLSSTEIEYIALAMTATNLLWMKNCLAEIEGVCVKIWSSESAIRNLEFQNPELSKFGSIKIRKYKIRRKKIRLKFESLLSPKSFLYSARWKENKKKNGLLDIFYWYTSSYEGEVLVFSLLPWLTLVLLIWRHIIILGYRFFFPALCVCIQTTAA